MPIFIMDEVKEYKNKRYNYKTHERLFLFNKSSLTRAMKLGIKISKIEECSIHYLRHAHTSFLIKKGFSPNLVSERIETTLETYSHLYPNKQEQVAKIIQESHEVS